MTIPPMERIFHANEHRGCNNVRLEDSAADYTHLFHALFIIDLLSFTVTADPDGCEASFCG